MADNTTTVTPPGSTNADVIRDIDRGGLGVKTQVVQLDAGGAAGESLVSSGNPLPISAASLPLPAGAATAAGLTTINTTLGTPLQAGGNVAVTNFPATQPVSVAAAVTVAQATAANLNATVTGTVTTTPPAHASTNIDQVGGAAVTLGAKTSANSIPVVLASDEATLPISAASLPLPAGAATSALQTTINTTLGTPMQQTGGTVAAVTAITNPVTVAQATAANLNATVTGAVSVSNFPATQPISGTVTVIDSVPLTVTGTVTVIDSVPLTVTGAVSVSNLPATQPVSGTVAVSNLPATQAVTLPATPAVTQDDDKQYDDDGIPYVNPNVPGADIATGDRQNQILAATQALAGAVPRTVTGSVAVTSMPVVATTSALPPNAAQETAGQLQRIADTLEAMLVEMKVQSTLLSQTDQPRVDDVERLRGDLNISLQ